MLSPSFFNGGQLYIVHNVRPLSLAILHLLWELFSVLSERRHSMKDVDKISQEKLQLDVASLVG